MRSPKSPTWASAAPRAVSGRWWAKQVLLSVPSVKIVTREAASKLVERENAKKLVAVQQSFEGPFAGKALLIFPEAQSLELVRSIVGDQHSLEDVIDLEQEALAETGNIILERMLGDDRECPAPDDADVTAIHRSRRRSHLV